MTLKADLKRYPKRPWFKEQSIWAIAVYRFGKWGDRRRTGAGRWICNRLYWPMHRIVETISGVSIPKGAEVGPGLRIWHFGNVIVNEGSKIGANCTMRHGVTIGNREEGGPCPVIEDEVDIGAYAQILGGIRVGRGARIGAMSVVLRDVPPGATAVGVPAKIVAREQGDSTDKGAAGAADEGVAGESLATEGAR
ncbi:MAG: serine acetyltransferase [Planctomycetota bacterium]|nr:serine acetyltransferase [Planctomycetota bacterium]